MARKNPDNSSDSIMEIRGKKLIRGSSWLNCKRMRTLLASWATYSTNLTLKHMNRMFVTLTIGWNWSYFGSLLTRIGKLTKFPHKWHLRTLFPLLINIDLIFSQIFFNLFTVHLFSMMRMIFYIWTTYQKYQSLTCSYLNNLFKMDKEIGQQ